MSPSLVSTSQIPKKYYKIFWTPHFGDGYGYGPNIFVGYFEGTKTFKLNKLLYSIIVVIYFLPTFYYSASSNVYINTWLYKLYGPNI